MSKKKRAREKSQTETKAQRMTMKEKRGRAGGKENREDTMRYCQLTMHIHRARREQKHNNNKASTNMHISVCVSVRGLHEFLRRQLGEFAPRH